MDTLGLLGLGIFLRSLYLIPLANLADLRRGVERLNRRAAKLGQAPAILAEVEAADVVTWRTADDGERRALVRRPVMVYGERVALAGWSFVATLSHEDGDVILRTVPGESLPKAYRSAKPTCDHCRVSRQRNETFVVRHENGEVRQVGRQCLGDFLGGQTPENLARRYLWLAELGALAEDSGEERGGRERLVERLETYLGYVSALVRRDGWLSRTASKEGGGRATADGAWIHAFEPGRLTVNGDTEPRVTPSAEDKGIAGKAVAWAQDWEDDSDYAHNLRVISNSGWVDGKRAGLAASIVPAYQRATAPRFTPVAAYLGTVGEKALLEGRLIGVGGYATTYGWTKVFRFDVGGHLVVWKSSGAGLAEGGTVGATYYLSATIKAHQIYRGEHQTEVARAIELTAENATALRAKAERKAIREAKKAAKLGPAGVAA